MLACPEMATTAISLESPAAVRCISRAFNTQRNKTFFFANYEGLRLSNAATLSGNMPTTAQEGGTFRQGILPPLHWWIRMEMLSRIVPATPSMPARSSIPTPQCQRMDRYVRSGKLHSHPLCEQQNRCRRVRDS